MTTVLIVEDDEKLRASLTRYLSAQGHEVNAVGSVKEALENLVDRQVEVLVTDLRMADEDGIELIQRARELSPTTRSILMSAYASAKDHKTAVALGAVSVLCKPFSSKELVNAVQQAIDCGTGFRGSVHGLSLIDLLQMFHYGGRSISISVTGLIAGSIHVKNGEVIHAIHGDLVGEDALQSLLSQTAGAITTGPSVAVEPTITRSFQSLLLELLRLLDEGGPPPTSPGALDELNDARAPTTLFPPAADADSSDGAVAVSDSERPKAIGRMGANIVSVISTMSGEAAKTTAMLVDPGEGKVTPLRGLPFPTSEVLDSTNALVAQLDKLEPGWERYESFHGPVAVGLLRCRNIPGYVLITEVLIGRYPIVKFRAQMGRLAEVV